MNIQDFRNQFGSHRPTLQEAKGLYAVLVPLVEKEDGLYLLYEVRSAGLRHHTGEVCFPGGRMEDGESPVDCALRETYEELGISSEAIEILGQLDFIYLRSESLMFPVLARIEESALDTIKRSEAEVADTFLVPLRYLQAHPPTRYHYALHPQVDDAFPYDEVQTPPNYTWLPGRMDIPVYHGLPYPLWGLTARITDWLIRSMDGQ